MQTPLQTMQDSRVKHHWRNAVGCWSAIYRVPDQKVWLIDLVKQEAGKVAGLTGLSARDVFLAALDQAQGES